MTASGRVVVVNATGVRSGAEGVLLDVVDEILSRGGAVTLVAPDGPLAAAIPPAVGRVHIPPLVMGGEVGAARAVAAVRALVRWLRAGMVLRATVRPGDVVLVNSLLALPALRCALPRRHRRRLGVRTAWLVHDTLASRKQRAVARMGGPAVSVAVAVSAATAAPIRGIVGDVRVRVNGVRMPPPGPSGRRPIPGRVGILAALTPWKGQAVLLEAVADVPEVTLDVAGAGFPGGDGYVRALHTRAARPDLAGRVRFLGHVDSAEVLGTWELVVSASVSPEAGPLGVLEAMAAGVPVIATDHGGASEYLAGGAGVLVPPNDPGALAAAIRRLEGDPELRAHLAARARERVARDHDIRRTLPALVDALVGAQRP